MRGIENSDFTPADLADAAQHVDVFGRDDDSPARALATAAERGRVDKHIQDLFSAGCSMRGSQARHLAAFQGGADAICIAATGSGKGKSMFALAIADYLQRLRSGGDTGVPRPVDLVLIPMANMGDGHKQGFDDFLASSTAAASTAASTMAGCYGPGPGCPAALYVERVRFDPLAVGHVAASPNAANGIIVCDNGHALSHERVRNKTFLLWSSSATGAATPSRRRTLASVAHSATSTFARRAPGRRRVQPRATPPRRRRRGARDASSRRRSPAWSARRASTRHTRPPSGRGSRTGAPSRARCGLARSSRGARHAGGQKGPSASVPSAAACRSAILPWLHSST